MKNLLTCITDSCDITGYNYFISTMVAIKQSQRLSQEKLYSVQQHKRYQFPTPAKQPQTSPSDEKTTLFWEMSIKNVWTESWQLPSRLPLSYTQSLRARKDNLWWTQLLVSLQAASSPTRSFFALLIALNVHFRMDQRIHQTKEARDECSLRCTQDQYHR